MSDYVRSRPRVNAAVEESLFSREIFDPSRLDAMAMPWWIAEGDDITGPAHTSLISFEEEAADLPFSLDPYADGDVTFYGMPRMPWDPIL